MGSEISTYLSLLLKKGGVSTTFNCCFRTGTDQGNPTVESKHSIAIATQGFDAM